MFFSVFLQKLIHISLYFFQTLKAVSIPEVNVDQSLFTAFTHKMHSMCFKMYELFSLSNPTNIKTVQLRLRSKQTKKKKLLKMIIK